MNQHTLAAATLFLALAAAPAWGLDPLKAHHGVDGERHHFFALDQAPVGYYYAVGERRRMQVGSTALVTMFSPDGAVDWVRTLGAGSFLAAASIPGGLLAAGKRASLFGDDDIKISVVDVCGGLVFERAFGGARDDRAFAAAATADGHLLAAGSTFSAGPLPDRQRGWLAKLGTDGVVHWQRSYRSPGASDVHIQGVLHLMPVDRYQVIGSVTIEGNSRPLWFAVHPANGEVVAGSAFRASGDQIDSFHALAADLPQTGFVVAGGTTSFAPTGVPAGWLLRFDELGAPIFQRSYYGLTAREFHSVEAAPGVGSWDQGYVLAGWLANDEGRDQPWLLRTGPTGRRFEDLQFETAGETVGRLHGVFQDPSGGIVAAGESSGAWPFRGLQIHHPQDRLLPNCSLPLLGGSTNTGMEPVAIDIEAAGGLEYREYGVDVDTPPATQEVLCGRAGRGAPLC